jgi:hypothetical protein
LNSAFAHHLQKEYDNCRPGLYLSGNLIVKKNYFFIPEDRMGCVLVLEQETQ